MNHLQLAASESFVSGTERRWLAWVEKVEGMLGHSLDGDHRKDGYSLDYAHEAFLEGASAVEYALAIHDAGDGRRA
jgi:hypothetical protein